MKTGKKGTGTKREAAQAANRNRRARKRRGRKTLHHLVVVAFVLAAGVVLSLTVFFKIEAVLVTGTDRYDPEEVAASTGIALGDNLLRIPADTIRSQLPEVFPYIERVEVRRRFPSTVEIHVTQSTPIGALSQEGDEFVLITGEGKILERGLILIPQDVPLVKGIEAAEKQPGEYLGQWEREQKGIDETPAQKEAREARDALRERQAEEQMEGLRMLQYLFEAMEDVGFHDITNVDLTDKLNIRIMYENRMLLELGSEGDLSYKLKHIRKALEILHPKAQGTLYAADASLNNRTVYKPAENFDSRGFPLDVPKGQEGEEADPGGDLVNAA